eukprot:COSAG06_NODE_35360_length_461_cov_0.676796_1_plen_62_part_10
MNMINIYFVQLKLRPPISQLRVVSLLTRSWRSSHAVVAAIFPITVAATVCTPHQMQSIVLAL